MIYVRLLFHMYLLCNILHFHSLRHSAGLKTHKHVLNASSIVAAIDLNVSLNSSSISSMKPQAHDSIIFETNLNTTNHKNASTEYSSPKIQSKSNWKNIIKNTFKLPSLYIGYFGFLSATAFAISKFICWELSLFYAGSLLCNYAHTLATFSLNGGSMWAREMGGIDAKTQNREIFNLVQSVANDSYIRHELNTFIIPVNDMNAFASGVFIRNSCVGLTQGLINKLSRDELKAVIAHECGHLVNKDCLRSMHLFAMISGFQWLQYLGFDILDAADRVWERKKNPLDTKNQKTELAAYDDTDNILFHIINETIHNESDSTTVQAIGYGLVGSGLVVSTIGTLFQLSISRNREYHADYHAVKLYGPKPMINALIKLSQTNSKIPSIAQSFHHGRYSSMFFDNQSRFFKNMNIKLDDDPPDKIEVDDETGFISKIRDFLSILDTHPPIIKRIRRLKYHHVP